MNFNNFTIKSQEVIQKAIELTRSAGQQQIEPLHILKAITLESETIINFVLQKLGITASALIQALDRETALLPKVSGADVTLSRESNDALQKAVDYSKKQGDEYVKDAADPCHKPDLRVLQPLVLQIDGHITLVCTDGNPI